MPKGFGYGPETNKQERKNLMQDMPVVKDATGGRSWMSKHSKSALHMGHSPAEMGHDSPAKKYGAMKGDQSKTRLDYKNYKGTDKGYHGHSGSSHGDQSASKADYTSAAAMSPYKMGHDSPAKHKGSGYGAKHEEEVSHGDGAGMHSHAYGRQKKQDEGKERAEKRKKVKATIKAGKTLAKSM